MYEMAGARVGRVGCLAHVREALQPALPADSPFPPGISGNGVSGVEFSRMGASSVTSCYPLALLPHLGYLPKIWACSLVVSGSCSGRKVGNSSNVIALPVLFRGRAGDFTRTFFGWSCNFGLFRPVPGGLGLPGRFRALACSGVGGAVGYGGGLPDWWAARWPISGLGCQWRGCPMFRTVAMEIHKAAARSRVHAASLIGFLMAVSFRPLGVGFLELLLLRQAPDIPAMWRRISCLRLNPKSGGTRKAASRGNPCGSR